MPNDSICIYIIDSGDQVSQSRNLIFYQLYHVHVRVFFCDKLVLCKSASSVFPFFLSSFKISGFLKDESARTDNTVDVIKVTTDSLISCFCLVITVITHRLLSYQNCCILLKSVIWPSYPCNDLFLCFWVKLSWKVDDTHSLSSIYDLIQVI